MENDTIRREVEQSTSLLAFYDRNSGTFQYHPDLLDYLGHGLSGQPLWDYLARTGALPEDDAAQIRQICLSLDAYNSFFARYFQPVGMSLHAFIFILRGDTVTIALKDLTPDIAHTESGMYDELTGLPSRSAYCAQIEQIIARDPSRLYAVFFFDIVKFKAINDRFGFPGGDKLLIHIASQLKSCSPDILSACRVSADLFSFLADVSVSSPEEISQWVLSQIKRHNLPLEINCNMGVYLVAQEERSGSRMLDKASLAQSSVKGSYTRKLGYYADSLRDQLLTEQDITGSMNTALKEGQFVVYYQPQYNHASGCLVGAEALIRWNHPKKGLLSPRLFVPIFEKNGFITHLDLYVFDQVCRLLRRCRDMGRAAVPIAVNFSIDDLYAPDFVQALEAIRTKHGVPASLLRIELTERLLMDNSEAVNAVFTALHKQGYLIELDDFGSGYSSLNVLKDLDVDVIKLDMLFLTSPGKDGRGRVILSSIVDMATRLGLTVIAEGVDTTAQADFLRSIGCPYMQGYLYARAMPEADYAALLLSSQIEPMRIPTA